MAKPNIFIKETTELVDDATDTVSTVVTRTEQKLEDAVAPMRKHVLKRFPIVFLLLITFGITATVTAMEQLIMQSAFLSNNPLLVLIIGLGLLIFTGTLYRKLG